MPGSDSAGGLRGLIDRRANDYSLQDTGERFQQLLVWASKPMLDYYFRMQIKGWDRLPDAPALLIGVHASGLLPIEAYLTGFQWIRHFGNSRTLHGTAHDVLMSLPGWGLFLRKIGTVPATKSAITEALDAGHDVILWPGGDVDALRPWTQRDRAILDDRTGFIKLAIRQGVPIVPVASIGGSDTLFMLTEGRSIARFLKLDKLLRTKAFPIAFGFPFGFAPGVLPQIPLPAKIRTEFLTPIEMGDDPALADDKDYVQAKYDEVVDSLQEAMTLLAGHRTFPLLG